MTFRAPIPFGCVEQLRLILEDLGLPLELTQLCGGLLAGSVLPFAHGPVLMLRVRLDRSLHVRGAKNPAVQLVCLDLSPPALAGLTRSHGQQLPEHAVCGLASRGEVHLCLPAGADVALMAIDRSSFQRFCLDFGAEALTGSAMEANWMRLEARRFEDLRRCLLRLLAMPAGMAPPCSSQMLPLQPRHQRLCTI